MRIDAETGELPARRGKKEKSSGGRGVRKGKELHGGREAAATGK